MSVKLLSAFTAVAVVLILTLIISNMVANSWHEGNSEGWRRGFADGLCAAGNEWREELDNGDTLIHSCGK